MFNSLFLSSFFILLVQPSIASHGRYPRYPLHPRAVSDIASSRTSKGFLVERQATQSCSTCNQDGLGGSSTSASAVPTAQSSAAPTSSSSSANSNPSQSSLPPAASPTSSSPDPDWDPSPAWSASSSDFSSADPPSSYIPPTVTPETDGASSFAATTFTGNPKPSSAAATGTPDRLNRMMECSPCGKSSCSFSSNGNSSDAVHSLMVGTPVTNCDGSTSPVKTTSGGSITIQEAWSEGVSVGVGYGPLEIGGSWGHNRSKSVTWEQKIEIEVKPGQMGVLTARVQYEQTSGKLTIGAADAFPIISNQPVRLLSYGAEIVDCKAQFSSNTSSSFNCTSSAQMWLNHTPSMGSLIPIVLTVSLLTSLFTWG